MSSSPEIATKEEAQIAHDSYSKDILWDSLMAHTYYKYDHRYTVTEKGEELRGKCREVIVETLERVLVTGARNWNRTHYPDFKTFLFSVIDSIIIDEFRGVDKELKTIEYSGLEENESGADDKVKEGELAQLCIDLMKGFKASEEELKILECIIAGFEMPGEVREYLEIDKTKFHNLSRSFYRKWDKVKKKLRDYGY